MKICLVRNVCALAVALLILSDHPLALRASESTPTAANGSLIVYEGVDPTNHTLSLGTMNLDGTNQTVLVDYMTHQGKHASWSPDGSTIVFIDNAYGSIWTIKPDGSDAAEVLRCGDWCAIMDYPSWSPDGSKILFVAFAGDPNQPPQSSTINVLDIATGERTVVTEATFPQIVDTPQFSPDGSAIVFSMNELDDAFNQTGAALATVPVTGGDLTWLTDFDQFAYYPSWNATTNEILFGQEPILWSALADRDAQPLNLWTISPDGTELTQVTDVAQGEQVIQSSWTPDGDQIIATFVNKDGTRLAWIDPQTGAITPIRPEERIYARVQPVPRSDQ